MSENNDEIKFNKAKDFYLNKDFVSAINTIEEIQNKTPKILEFKYKVLLDLLPICEKANDDNSMLYCLTEMEKINPNDEHILLNIGLYLERVHDLPNALVYYTKVLDINKRNYDALIHTAFLFTSVENFQSALNYIEKAKRIKPNQFKTAYAYFKVYEKSARYKEALRYAKEMLILKPDDVNCYYDCARTYFHLFDYQNALEYCNKTLEYNPDDENMLCLKLQCLKKTGAVDNIRPMFDELIKKYPDSYTIKRLYAMEFLEDKDYENGMKYYLDVVSPQEIQNDRGKVEQKFTRYSQKRWRKENLSGKTLLIYQGPFGAGDFIMFSRYIPLVEEMAGKIIIEANKNFYDLFKYNFKKADVIEETKEGIDSNAYDYSISAMEFVYSMNMGFENIPGANGWLSIPDEKTEEAKNTGIFNTEKLKVGLFWRGSGGTMKERNIELEKLIPLFENEKCKFFSFDIEEKDEKTTSILEKYDIEDCSKYIKTSMDTGAFLKNLDLFISVDSFPLHLAGALGVKTFLYIPVLAEWRWFKDTESTPWYNSVKIFRQSENDTFEDIVKRIKEKINV